MAISDRNYDTRLSFGSKVNPLVVLIAIAMIIFVVLAFFRALAYVKMGQDADITGHFNENILCWFALSGDAGKLLTRPWTLLTCTFVHVNILQLFTGVLWLWCFGHILTDLTGYKKIVPVFIYGTLAGAVAFLLATNFIPAPAGGATSYFLGAGAATLAICAAATTISPNYKLLPMLGGGISLWILSVVYLVVDMATLPPSLPQLYIAHLASAASGFLFIYILRKGLDGSDWMNSLYDWIINLFNPEKPLARRNKIKITNFYKADKEPFSKTPRLTQKRLDEILDKISQNGYDQLSAEEKEFLARVSKEDVKGK